MAAGGAPEVAIFVDTLGSMDCGTVETSYDKFIDDLAGAASIQLVAGTSNDDEDWILPFNQALAGIAGPSPC